MKNYKAIIIDDEPDARDMLEELMKAHPEFRIVGKACNADEGTQQIIDHQPDLIFLDIEMPGKSGFDLIHGLGQLDYNPAIIFVTAFDKYAVEAIKHSAFDYILKPVDPDELDKGLQKFKTRNEDIDIKSGIEDIKKRLSPEKLRFNTRTGFVLIAPQSIVYLKADGNYSRIYMDDGTQLTVARQLGQIDKTLDQDSFIKINRSTIINKPFVLSINLSKRKVKLMHHIVETELTVSRSNLKRLNQCFG